MKKTNFKKKINKSKPIVKNLEYHLYIKIKWAELCNDGAIFNTGMKTVISLKS